MELGEAPVGTATVEETGEDAGSLEEMKPPMEKTLVAVKEEGGGISTNAKVLACTGLGVVVMMLVLIILGATGMFDSEESD